MVSLTSLACRAADISLCWSLVSYKPPLNVCMASLMLAHAGTGKAHTKRWFSVILFLLSDLRMGPCSIIKCADNPAQKVSVHLNTWYISMKLWWASGWVSGRRRIICIYPYADDACRVSKCGRYGNMSYTVWMCCSQLPIRSALRWTYVEWLPYSDIATRGLLCALSLSDLDNPISSWFSS